MSGMSPSSVLFTPDGYELAVAHNSNFATTNRALLVAGLTNSTNKELFALASEQGGLGSVQMSNKQAIQIASVVTSSGSSNTQTLLNGAQEIILVVNVGTVTGVGSIQYSIREVDPGDNSTAFGPTASTAVITTGNAPGVFTAKLSVTSATDVRITWTVVGAFSATIYSTIITKSTPSSQVITGSITATNDSVGTDGAAFLGFDTQVGGKVTTAAPSYTNGNLDALSLTTLGGLRIDGVYATGTANATAADAMVSGGYVTTAAPTYTTGQLNALSLTTAGALRIDGSGTTQPVSGTVAVSSVGGTVAVTQSTSPWVVSGTVTSNMDGYATTAAPTYVNNTFNPLSLDLSGNLRTVATQGTSPWVVSGTVTANQGTSPWVTSVTGSVAVTQSTSPWIIAGGGTAGTPASGVVTVQGISGMTPLSVQTNKASSSTVTGVATTANTNSTLLASNGNRLFATVYNGTGKTMYIKLGATASTASFTTQLFDKSYWEVPNDYTGIVDAFSLGTGTALVTELTP